MSSGNSGRAHSLANRAVARRGMFLMVVGALAAAFLADRAAAADTVRFNFDIRPLLSENCFACHGPDAEAREADLRLDIRDEVVERGVIVPGSPDDSQLVTRILAEDEYERMPPPDSHKTLTAEQKDLFVRWIAEGAEYEPHWSFIAPTRPEPPAVQKTDWPRNPIDYFILAGLEKAGLEPAEEADRRTLARRLSLDLTGLPPSIDEVETFVADESPDYYEKYVDQLMSSPHWGEHRARFWLDAARYADTHGIHFDNFREIWSYRDWVIQAFQDNMPFDQFTTEQLAGDLLPDPTLDQLVGTGFNRCNITTNEGGAIAEEYLVLYTRDRTETTSQIWLGLTAGCAVCHDHKFDPLTQREFYELAAFFNNTTQEAMDRNIKDTPPVITVPQPADRARWIALEDEIPAAQQQVAARRSEAEPAFADWLATATSDVFTLSVPGDSLELHAPLDEGTSRQVLLDVKGRLQEVPLTEGTEWQPGRAGGQALLLQGAALELADVGDFERDQAFTVAAWIKLQGNDSHGALAARMDRDHGFRGWDLWVQRRQVGLHLIHQWPDNALKVVAKEQVKANEWTHVVVRYDGSGSASGVKIFYNGQPQEVSIENDRLRNSTTRTEVPFKIGQRHNGDPISAAGIADLRIYTRLLADGEAESLAKMTRLAELVKQPAEQRSEQDREELFGWWLNALDAIYTQRTQQVAELEREQADIRARGTVAYVTNERDEPATAYILNRGEYDQRRDQVNADTPAVLPPMPEDAPRNRLGFAQWLLLPEHPLTSRVTVNRFWQQLYGTGLVRTAGDFGITGEMPSHPELLDWLAVEFRESGWDVQHLFRLLVTSSAYRQAATTMPLKLELDPDNRLISRGPRYRMDAEMIRDYALAASGLLVRKIGGPSVKPYQPEGVWEAVAMIGSNTRNYERDSGPSLYRRSLYTFWKRSAPPASMDVLNAPNRETCVVHRDLTNTPLQALVTLNDVQFVEAARHLAQRTLQQEADSDAERMEFVARAILARPLRDPELEIAQRSLDELSTYYAEHEDDARRLIAEGESPADSSLEPARLASWTMLVNQLFNLDEVLNK